MPRRCHGKPCQRKCKWQYETRRKVSDMNTKNKLGRAGIAAAAAAIGGLGLTGVASASTAHPVEVTSVSHHAGPASAAAHCYGTSCANLDPQVEGCNVGRVDITSKPNADGTKIEVRHSHTCKASWARIEPAHQGWAFTIAPNGRPPLFPAEYVRYSDVAWFSNMVDGSQPAQACLLNHVCATEPGFIPPPFG